MRWSAIGGAIVLAAEGAGQTIEPDYGGDGYRISFWSGQIGKVNLDHAVTTPIPVVTPKPDSSLRLRARNAREFWDEFGALRLGYGRGLVKTGEDDRYSIKFPWLPHDLLGTVGLRLNYVHLSVQDGVESGQDRTHVSRAIVPFEPVTPPRRVRGQQLLLRRDPNRVIYRMDGTRLSEDLTDFRRATLKAPYDDSIWGPGGWTADLEGVGEVRFAGDPLPASGVLPTVPLSTDPKRTEAAYVGREFWSYPHSIVASGPDALLQGRARLERRKVRIRGLVRLWRSESVPLSAMRGLNGMSDLSVDGQWWALHPMIAIVEPADGRPVRADLVRRDEMARDPTREQALAFGAPGARRLYTVRVGDWWQLDRALSVEGPRRILRAAKPGVRRAIEEGRPLPGMTPEELAWAVGWPFDPRPREELEATRDGVWEYPMGYQGGFATFRNGRLADYRIVRYAWPHPSLGLPPPF